MEKCSLVSSRSGINTTVTILLVVIIVVAISGISYYLITQSNSQEVTLSGGEPTPSILEPAKTWFVTTVDSGGDINGNFGRFSSVAVEFQLQRSCELL